MKGTPAEFVFALLLFCVPARAATRVALVSNSEADAVAQVLDLAVVRLAEREEVHVLERRQIAAVLEEQKLAFSALVDPVQSIRAGKLLSVDVFAVLPAGGGVDGGELVSGLVVYEAQTGVRLWDRTIGGRGVEDVADAVAQGVGGALDKRGSRRGTTRTVSLVSVRNADLPRDMDSVCEAAAALLERQVLRSPDIAVLERSRLVYVNRERQLPTGALHEKLRKSLFLLDLELSRGEKPKQVRATVLLSDAGHTSCGKVTVTGTARKLVKLAAKLAEALLKQLRVAPAEPAGSPAREARRFAVEAKLYRSHGQHSLAARAAEAAFALQPSLEYQAQLSRLLLDDAPLPTSRRKSREPDTAGVVRRSLGVVRRAIELRRDLTEQAMKTAPHSLLELRGCQYPTFNEHLGARIALRLKILARREGPEGKEAEAVRQLARAYLNLSAASLVQWRRAGSHRFERFTTELWQDTDQQRRLARDTGEMAECIEKCVRLWLAEIERVPSGADAAVEPRSIAANRLLDPMLQPLVVGGQQPINLRPWDSAAYWQSLAELLNEMRQHRHPVVRLYGYAGHAVALSAKGAPAADRDRAFDAFMRELRSALANPGEWPPGQIRIQAYYAACTAIDAVCDSGTGRSERRRMKPRHVMLMENELVGRRRMALWRLMLDRNELVPLVVIRGLFCARICREPAAMLELIDRTTPLCRQADCRLFTPSGIDPTELETQLAKARNRLFAAHPELKKRLGDAASWYHARCVLSVEQHAEIDAIRQPFVVDGFAYAVARHGLRGMRPFRIPLEAGGGQLEWLGPTRELTGTDEQLLRRSARTPSVYSAISAACLGNRHFYVGTRDEGIHSFPTVARTLRGRRSAVARTVPGRRKTQSAAPRTTPRAAAATGEIKQSSLRDNEVLRLDVSRGLPVNAVCALAELNGKLYAGLLKGGGYVVAVDPTSGSVEVLASSRRKQRFSPLDGQRQFRITFMTADSERNRVLVGTRSTGRTGLWQIDGKTGKVRALLQCSGPDWGSPVRNNSILLESYRTTVSYDLGTGTAQLIRAVGNDSPGTDVPPADSAPIRHCEVHAGPQALINGWLWMPRPLSRISLETGELQLVPPLDQTRKQPINPATIIEPLDGGKHVLVGDCHGLWVLTLEDSERGAE